MHWHLIKHATHSAACRACVEGDMRSTGWLTPTLALFVLSGGKLLLVTYFSTVHRKHGVRPSSRVIGSAPPSSSCSSSDMAPHCHPCLPHEAPLFVCVHASTFVTHFRTLWSLCETASCCVETFRCCKLWCKLRAQVFARFAGADKNLVRRVFPCKALSWLDPFSV